MKQLIICLSILLLFAQSSLAQTALTLPTAGERKAADIASYITLGTNMTMAIANCYHNGEWDTKCLLRVGVKNGATLLISEGLKRLIHEGRPCEPSHACGIDTGTGSIPSGHAIFSFVNVDPFGQSHLGFSVEYSIAFGTATGRVLAGKHNWWDVLASAVMGQGINAATNKLIK